MKKVLVLGASGNIAPYVMPDLEKDYDLYLSDIVPHPDGKPIINVDITSYPEVLEVSRGMDAIMNFTVLRDDPVISFEVSTKGAYHVMKAAAALGIKKVVHTGPQSIRNAYDHEFDLDDVPLAPGVGYYGITKYLSMEICEIFSRTYDIQTVCFLFNGLGSKPTEHVTQGDFPPFTVVWEDLQHACRLALEIESVPGNFQSFNLLSYFAQGKYQVEKAKRMLGFKPMGGLEDYFRRVTD